MNHINNVGIGLSDFIAAVLRKCHLCHSTSLPGVISSPRFSLNGNLNG